MRILHRADPMPTLQDVTRYIQRGNCPDCFHAECLRRADLARELLRLEEDEPRGADGI